MNRTLTVSALTLIAAAGALWAQTKPASSPNKVGVIHFEGAISSTQQGQKALADLQVRYDPKRKDLEKRQNELSAKRDQLSKGSSTLSEDAKQALMRDIDKLTTSLSRDLEDAQTDYQQDVDRILQDFYPRIKAAIDKYAAENGYSLVLDIGSPQTPVVYVTDAVDITNDIIALYDKGNPGPEPASAPAQPAATPAKPVVPPAKK